MLNSNLYVQGEYWSSHTQSCPRLPGAGPYPKCSGNGCPPGSPGTPGWKPTAGAGCVPTTDLITYGINNMCFKDGDCCEDKGGNKVFCNMQRSACDPNALMGPNGGGCCEVDYYG